MASKTGPGELWECNHRSETNEREWDGRLKLMTFNIERGYKWKEIIAHLLAMADRLPDVLLLQEVDIGCRRTGNVNVAEELAKALSMQCVFTTEYVELDSDQRPKHLAGGGVHGNAILSRFPVLDRGAFLHTHQSFDWSTRGAGFPYYQPREGGRVVVWADIQLPGRRTSARARVYSCHLENFCGIVSRLVQFAELLSHAHRTVESQQQLLVIGGDFNTLMHGLARWLPCIYPGDELRFQTLGQSEGQWWARNVFTSVPFREYLQGSSRQPPAELLSLAHEEEKSFSLAHRLRDPNMDDTVSIWPVYSAKLDWLLTNCAEQVVESCVGPPGLSDHCYVSSIIQM